MFQSLWYRARSFDRGRFRDLFSWYVSIPLIQGKVFRQTMSNREMMNVVSIPLIQGKVFRHSILNQIESMISFNPFDTGQGLSTGYKRQMGCSTCFNPFDTGQGLSTRWQQQISQYKQVSIPLIQGKVFRLFYCHNKTLFMVSIPLIQGKVFRLRKGLFFLHFNKLNNGFPKFLRSRRVSCWIDWKIINFIPSTCQKQRYFNKKHRTIRA